MNKVTKRVGGKASTLRLQKSSFNGHISQTDFSFRHKKDRWTKELNYKGAGERKRSRIRATKKISYSERKNQNIGFSP